MDSTPAYNPDFVRKQALEALMRGIIELEQKTQGMKDPQLAEALGHLNKALVALQPEDPEAMCQLRTRLESELS